MGKKSDPPPPPDYSDLTKASLESAKLWEQVARSQLDWAKEQDVSNRALMERVLGVQLPQLEEAHKMAMQDRARFERVFAPMEEAFAKEAVEYDTEARREEMAGRRAADVATNFESQRANALRQLEGYGIDPSQTRFAALDLGYRAQQAATSALAQNQGRREVEQTGRALRGEAINIGRGYPAQVATSQGVVNQTAAGAAGGSATLQGATAGAMGTAAPYAQMAQSGYVNTANMRNLGYQNAMDQYTAQQANSPWGGIGELTGALGSAWIGRPKAEGGPVEAIPSGKYSENDTILTPTAKGEYVIPADVMRKKGSEYFDRLLDKYKDGGTYDQERAPRSGPSPEIADAMMARDRGAIPTR